MKIIFYGTPEFAVPSLDILVNNGYKVCAVVTATDAPAGRGLKLKYSPIKEYAVANNLEVLQPAKLKDPEFLERIKSLQPDVQVVVAFRMMPEVLWQLPPLGTFNLHGSLLPQYRGAAPINWAIINGETHTGVTTFFLQQQIDTGNIILQQSMPINQNDNASSLHNRMMYVGADLVLQTIRKIENGSVQAMPQLMPSSGILKGAPKIFKETCLINFNNTIGSVHNFIRGLAMHPCAYTFITNNDGEKLQLKIFEAVAVAAHHNVPVGTAQSEGKKYLQFACTDGWIQCINVQLQGKKAMIIEDFLRGYKWPTL